MLIKNFYLNDDFRDFARNTLKEKGISYFQAGKMIGKPECYVAARLNDKYHNVIHDIKPWAKLLGVSESFLRTMLFK